MASVAPRQPWRKAKNNTGASDNTRANSGCGAACSESISSNAIAGNVPGGTGANTDYDVAVGPYAQAYGGATTAVGEAAMATAGGATAVGQGSTADAFDSMALGFEASTAGFANSVALGANSVVDRANSVSVGAPGAERQIANVAAGTAQTDAVNLGQVQAVAVSAGGNTHYYNINEGGTQGRCGRGRREGRQGGEGGKAGQAGPCSEGGGQARRRQT